jgi:hypothetical protein
LKWKICYLSLFWSKILNLRRWRHIVILILSVAQAYGGVLYFAGAYHQNWRFIPVAHEPLKFWTAFVLPNCTKSQIDSLLFTLCSYCVFFFFRLLVDNCLMRMSFFLPLTSSVCCSVMDSRSTLFDSSFDKLSQLQKTITIRIQTYKRTNQTPFKRRKERSFKQNNLIK